MHNTHRGVIKKAPHIICRAFIEIVLKTISDNSMDHTHPVGFGRPAILQAPFPGPDGNNS